MGDPAEENDPPPESPDCLRIAAAKSIEIPPHNADRVRLEVGAIACLLAVARSH